MLIGHRIVRQLTSRQTVRFATSSSSSMISDMIKDFRWKAAQALTSNLSDTERSKLLDQLDAVDRQEVTSQEAERIEEARIDTETTIGEAVAAARIEEAQMKESLWLKEKKTLLHDAEEAARSRVENELLVQKRRFEAEERIRVEQGKEDEKEHPILGTVVADLGYKQVYQVPARTLLSIPVWKKQRVYRHDRAKVIVKDKLKTPYLGLPGIIVLHEDKDGKMGILDGQHRVGALALLLEREDVVFDLEKILVEAYASTGEEDHSEEIFVEINKSEPIKLVDMPGVATTKDRNIITTAATKLQFEFPEMFKTSQKCRAPHVNSDNLRDALFAAEVLKRHDLSSTTALVEWIKAQNDVLQDKYSVSENTTTTTTASPETDVNEKALKKANDHKFYLGLEASWLYH